MQSEERLRLLIDSATDYAIFTMTAEGTIDSWNTGAERMFGYTGDEIIGRQVDVLFTAKDRDSGTPRRELEGRGATGGRTTSATTSAATARCSSPAA